MQDFLHPRIETFLRCAPFATMSEAALRLGMTQSALSIAIKKLEDELKCRLFERHPHGIRLTPKGQVFYVELLKQKKSLERTLPASVSDSHVHTVRMGAVPHFADHYLFPLLKKKSFDQVNVQILCDLSLTAIQAVEERSLDFAFVSWTKEPRGVEFIRIGEDPFAIVGLKSKFQRIQKMQSIEELEREPWVHFPRPQYDWKDALPSNKSGFITRDIHSFRNIILGGYAIGYIQTLAFKKEERKLLVSAGLKPKHSDVAFYAVFRRDQNPEAKTLMHAILQEVSRQEVNRHEVSRFTAP